jgi:hypothetical protein
MESETLQARIEHEIAELRARFPRVTACHPTLEQWEGKHALRLDIRWPQHQSLVSGPPSATPEAAVRAAFDQAAHALTRHA